MTFAESTSKSMSLYYVRRRKENEAQRGLGSTGARSKEFRKEYMMRKRESRKHTRDIGPREHIQAEITPTNSPFDSTTSTSTAHRTCTATLAISSRLRHSFLLVVRPAVLRV